MDIFSFFRKQEKPADLARERLKFVLTTDRVNCSPQIMEAIKNDIIKVISTYLDIDTRDMDIQIGPTGESHADGQALFANIPIRAVRKVPRAL